VHTANLNQQQSDQVVLSAPQRDTALNSKVIGNLNNKGGLDRSAIHAATSQGVVTLSGSSTTPHAKQIAGNSARAIQGVHRVQNNLKVVAAAPVATVKPVSIAREAILDSWITSKVKTELLVDSLARPLAMRVRTRLGTVELQGTLQSQAQVQHVWSLVRGVSGVRKVDVSKVMLV
jgi:hyperosmotically inducible protein